MNIIFGKYQLSLYRFSSSGHVSNSNELCKRRFSDVIGLGPTKIKWIIALIGGCQNIRISKFFKNSKIINREKYIEINVSKLHMQFLGMELKHRVFRHKSKIEKFIPSSRKRIKSSPSKLRTRKTKLNSYR